MERIRCQGHWPWDRLVAPIGDLEFEIWNLFLHHRPPLFVHHRLRSVRCPVSCRLSAVPGLLSPVPNAKQSRVLRESADLQPVLARRLRRPRPPSPFVPARIAAALAKAIERE